MTSQRASFFGFLLLAACGGRVDSAAGTSGTGGGSGGSVIPPSPTASTNAEPRSKPCVAPPGASLLACDLPRNVTLLSATYALSVDETAKVATILDVSSGAPKEVFRWAERLPLAEARAAVHLDEDRFANKPSSHPTLYRASAQSLDAISLADGNVTIVDPAEVIYFRRNAYVVRQNDGTYATRSFYRNGQGRYVVQQDFEEARYFLGYTNMHDDQPTDLYATSLTAPTRVIATMATQGDVGELLVDPKLVQNQHDALVYARTQTSPNGQSTREIVFAKIRPASNELVETPFVTFPASVPEPRFVTVGAGDLYWVQDGALYTQPLYKKATPIPVSVVGVLGAPAFYTKMSGRMVGGVEQVDPYLAILVTDSENPGRAMLVGKVEPSAEMNGK